MSLDIDHATGRLFTVSMTNNRAAVIETRANPLVRAETVAYYDLPGASSASGVAYDPARNRLFVASQASDNVVVLDVTTGTVVANIPTGAGALNATYDAVHGYVYVSNRTGGTITVIDAATLTVIANLPGGTNPNHVTTGTDGVVYAVNKAPVVDGQPTNSIQRIVPVAEVVPTPTPTPEPSATPSVTPTVAPTSVAPGATVAPSESPSPTAAQSASVSAAPQGGSLPSTGSSSGTMIAGGIAVLLLALGGGLVLLRHRVGRRAA